ncbi:MAG TPA: YIP1 family protein [Vicinamibacteria bacterium]|nr:YIP1 family protein [Vicinamibacteria bacterium]
MTQCPNCHTVLPDPPERFCPSCGTDLAAAVTAAPPYPPPPPPGYPPSGYAPPSYPPPGGGGYGAPPPGGQTPWERRSQIGIVNALIETTKQVLLQPVVFFRSMPVTGGLGDPLLYAVIIGYAGLLVSTIYNLVFRGVLTSSLSRFGGNSEMEQLASFMQGGTGVVVNLILGPVFIVVFLFVSAGIFHLVLLALGGAARGFEGTFRVAGYSQAASIFNIIPVCGGLVGLVYVIVLLVIGLSEAHGISRGKAAAGVLIPFVILCCCCSGIIAAAVFGMAGALNRMR